MKKEIHNPGWIRIFIILLVFLVIFSTSKAANINVLTNPGFEDSNGWAARNCTFAYSTADKHGGSRSGLASGRTATWQGIQQSILDKVVAGSSYSIYAYLKLANSSSDTVKISIQRTINGNTTYYTAASGTANSSSWVKLSGSYTVDANLTALYVYFEGPASGVNFYVDDANVFGQAPAVIESNAEGEIDTSTRHQKLEGFGAAGAWYEGTLVTLGNSNPNIYNVLFRDLGLDIYRLRNAYDQSGGSSYIDKSATIVSHAATSLGHPIKILISSWSPPAYLKSDGNTVGGTLAKDFNDPNNGSSGYVYQRFAQWWHNSIIDFNNHGMPAEYASMQNEPDWLANWDTCKFTPTESSSWAGYNKAFEALCAKMATLPNPPKLLAPESAGFIQLSTYLDAISDKSQLYSYSHHLYNSNTGGSGSDPDGFIGDMTSFATQFADKPRMQTEFSAGETTFVDAMNLAKLMHNSLTVEDAAAYFHWDLFWGTSGSGLVSITSSTYTINPVYYAFKHYSAFTDPNWQRLQAETNSSALRISAFISPDNNQMSVIIINTSDTDTSLDLSLGNFEVADGNVYRTNSSLTEKCAFVGAFDGNIPLFLLNNSITTVAMRGKLLPANCQEVQDFGYGLPADLTGDCRVNYKDLNIIAGYWLNTNCAANNNCDGADFATADGIVNFADFNIFAAQWMQCNDPQASGCIANW